MGAPLPLGAITRAVAIKSQNDVLTPAAIWLATIPVGTAELPKWRWVGEFMQLSSAKEPVSTHFLFMADKTYSSLQDIPSLKKFVLHFWSYTS